MPFFIYICQTGPTQGPKFQINEIVIGKLNFREIQNGWLPVGLSIIMVISVYSPCLRHIWWLGRYSYLMCEVWCRFDHRQWLHSTFPFCGESSKNCHALLTKIKAVNNFDPTGVKNNLTKFDFNWGFRQWLHEAVIINDYVVLDHSPNSLI